MQIVHHPQSLGAYSVEIDGTPVGLVARKTARPAGWRVVVYGWRVQPIKLQPSRRAAVDVLIEIWKKEQEK